MAENVVDSAVAIARAKMAERDAEAKAELERRAEEKRINEETAFVGMLTVVNDPLLSLTRAWGHLDWRAGDEFALRISIPDKGVLVLDRVFIDQDRHDDSWSVSPQTMWDIESWRFDPDAGVYLARIATRGDFFEALLKANEIDLRLDLENATREQLDFESRLVDGPKTERPAWKGRICPLRLMRPDDGSLLCEGPRCMVFVDHNGGSCGFSSALPLRLRAETGEM